jgi:hypothetical protein
MSDNTEQTSAGNTDWKKRELGALWRREGKNQNFLSGTLKIGEFGVEKEVKVVVFTNKGKAKNERAPDFIVYEDQPRDEFIPQKKEEAPVSAASESEGADVQLQEDADIPEVLR